MFIAALGMTARIRLAGKDICGYPANFVADQIEARRKQVRRLPSFCNNPHIIFPPALNLEQCSSEATAEIKADLISRWGGKTNHLLDLTAGFGVDALALSKIFERVTACEPNDTLRELASENFSRLSKGNIQWKGEPAESVLATKPQADWIYIDPSRRAGGSKVVLLQDCSPDVTALKQAMLEAAPNVLIKASPMLDLTLALKSLTETSHVAVVSVANECREVLFHLLRGHHGEPEIICLNKLTDGSMQEFV